MVRDGSLTVELQPPTFPIFVQHARICSHGEGDCIEAAAAIEHRSGTTQYVTPSEKFFTQVFCRNRFVSASCMN